MMHPRLIPGNASVALAGYENVIKSDRYVQGTVRQVAIPVCDLLREPDGALDRQLLYGAVFEVIEEKAGFGFGRSLQDGYVGYVNANHLRPHQTATHSISARSSHIYPLPDIKTIPTLCLPFGALVGVKSIDGDFVELNSGDFMPAQHLQAIAETADDFVSVFQRFLGVPYLWGGNSVWGMDCSGAVQLAMTAAGLTCPRDSDMQAAELGSFIDSDAPTERGDLVFWNGHLGVMTDAKTLLHANAFHMAVAQEPLETAKNRIKSNGGGKITAIKRL